MLLRGSATSICDAAGVSAGFCEEGQLFGAPIPEHGAEVKCHSDDDPPTDGQQHTGSSVQSNAWLRHTH